MVVVSADFALQDPLAFGHHLGRRGGVAGDFQDVGAGALGLYRGVQAQTAASQAALVADGRLGDAMGLIFAIGGVAQQGSARRDADARTLALVIVDLAADRGRELGQPVAGTARGLGGQARGGSAAMDV